MVNNNNQIDITPSWNFVAQGILAILDCNTNIKPKDRANIKGLLLDMSQASDQLVDLMKQLTEKLGLEDGCTVGKIEEEIDQLTLVERWLFQECEEPKRSQALKWLGKFGYDESN